MGPVRRLAARFSHLKLRVRLFLFFGLLITLPMGVMTGQLMEIYSRDMVEGASRQLQAATDQIAQGVSEQLGAVEEASSQMMLDRELTEFFSDSTRTDSELYLKSNQVTQTVGRYLRQDVVDVALLYTSRQVYGALTTTDSNKLTASAFEDSPLYRQAVEAQYAMVWVPTYDLADMFQLSYLKRRDSTLGYRYVFSAVRQMNFAYMDSRLLRMLPTEAERPILLVNIQTRALAEMIGDHIGYQGARYWVLTPQGGLVYDSAGTQPGQADKALSALAGAPAGFRTVELAGHQSVTCVSTIASTGWKLVTAVPLEEVVGSTVRDTRRVALSWLAALLLAALAAAYWVSRSLTRPIHSLVEAVGRVSGGDLSVQVPLPAETELLTLSRAFNDMTSHVQALIHENYEIHLRETEAQLMALNLQLNPHFLYNTLNIMSLTALEHGDQEVVDMISALSGMLQYALKDEREQVRLQEEMGWMNNYLSIMEVRYEGMFRVEVQAAPELYDYLVPKLILQPLVENCFKHGQIGAQPGGLIAVRAELQGETLRLYVEDNGRGMDVEQVAGQLGERESGRHVGLNNVYRRLRLVYGEGFGVQLMDRPGGGSVVALSMGARRAESASFR